jgi:hypothetical protein
MSTLQSLVRIDQVPLERPHFEIRLLRRLRAELRVPSYVIGKRIYFDLSDLDRYVDAQRDEAVQ